MPWTPGIFPGPWKVIRLGGPSREYEVGSEERFQRVSNMWRDDGDGPLVPNSIEYTL